MIRDETVPTREKDDHHGQDEESRTALAAVLALKLDAISADGKVSDGSGNKNDGVVTGAVAVVSDPSLGSCLSFPPSGGYITVNDPFRNNENFTISLWVKPAAINDGKFRSFIGKQEGAEWKPTLKLGPSNGILYYFSTEPAQTRRQYGIENFFTAAGEWVHVAWVKGGTTYAIYRNGAFFGTEPAPAQFYTANTSYLIGNADNDFNGQIASVRIYDRRLSAEEIAQIVAQDLADGKAEGEMGKAKQVEQALQTTVATPASAAGKSPAGAVLDLKLDAISADGKVSDSSGNKNDGVVTGAAAVVSDPSLGSCLSFPPSPSYITVNDPFRNTENFTIALWVKPDAMMSNSLHAFIGKYEGWGMKPTLWLNPRDGYLYHQSKDPSQPKQEGYIANFYPAAGEWVHVAWVKGGTTYEIYRNGTLFATNPAPAQFYTANTSYLIGAVMNDFYGQIARVRIYDRKLSAEELAQIVAQDLADGKAEGEMGKAKQVEQAPQTTVATPAGASATGQSQAHAVLDLKLDAISADGKVSDSSGNKNDGVVTGAAAVVSDPSLGSCLSFPPSGSHITVNDPFRNNENFTISVWVKPDAINDGRYHGIIGKIQDGAWKPSLWQGGANGGLFYYCSDPSVTQPDDTLVNFFTAAGEWVHVAWVKGGTTSEIYRNGTLFATKPAPAQFSTANTSYLIGTLVANDRDTGFHGQIARVRIYDRKLSAEELAQIIAQDLADGKAEGEMGKAKKVEKASQTKEPEHLMNVQAPDASKPSGAAPAGTGMVMVFDGPNSVVSLDPPLPAMPAGVTIEFWALGADSLPMSTSVFAAWRSDNARVLNIHLPWSNSAIYWDVGDEGYDRIRKKAEPWEFKGSWMHWAFVRDIARGEMSIYRNGALWHREAGKSRPIGDIAHANIGSYVDGAYQWSGRLAEFRIWDKPRTEQEIAADCVRRLTGREPGLVGCWPLDRIDANGSTPDLTGNRPGAVQGATTTPDHDLALQVTPVTAPETTAVPKDATGSTPDLTGNRPGSRPGRDDHAERRPARHSGHGPRDDGGPEGRRRRPGVPVYRTCDRRSRPGLENHDLGSGGLRHVAADAQGQEARRRSPLPPRAHLGMTGVSYDDKPLSTLVLSGNSTSKQQKKVKTISRRPPTGQVGR